MKKYLRHPVVQNALALYSVQFAEYVLPMIAIPYLARVLLPAGWGLVVYAQNFSSWMILVLEYGFGFSATREIARHRDNPDRHSGIVGEIFGANILLLAPAVAIAIVARFTVPEFQAHGAYLWLALAIAVTTGLRPFWYFQGIEDMKYPAWLNVFGRVLYTGGIFLLVKSRDGGWIVLTLQAVAACLVTALIAMRMYRRISFVWPTFELAATALKRGWAIFLSRSAAMLYTLANTTILGFFVSSASVAYYGGAERVVLSVLGLMAPFTQALYPRMSHLAASNRERATSAIRMGFLVFGLIGLVTCGLLIATAPWVIRILLGPSYRPAIGVLRVASLIVPFVAVSNILGMQWMLPFGMDRIYNRIQIGAGILNFALALILAPRFGAIGTAWCAVAAQGTVALCQSFLFFRSGGGAGRVSTATPSVVTVE